MEFGKPYIIPPDTGFLISLGEMRALVKIRVEHDQFENQIILYEKSVKDLNETLAAHVQKIETQQLLLFEQGQQILIWQGKYGVKTQEVDLINEQVKKLKRQNRWLKIGLGVGVPVVIVGGAVVLFVVAK